MTDINVLEKGVINRIIHFKDTHYFIPSNDSRRGCYNRRESKCKDSRCYCKEIIKGCYNSNSKGSYNTDTKGCYRTDTKGCYYSNSKGSYNTDTKGCYSRDIAKIPFNNIIPNLLNIILSLLYNNTLYSYYNLLSYGTLLNPNISMFYTYIGIKVLYNSGLLKGNGGGGNGLDRVGGVNNKDTSYKGVKDKSMLKGVGGVNNNSDDYKGVRDKSMVGGVNNKDSSYKGVNNRDSNIKGLNTTNTIHPVNNTINPTLNTLIDLLYNMSFSLDRKVVKYIGLMNYVLGVKIIDDNIVYRCYNTINDVYGVIRIVEIIIREGNDYKGNEDSNIKGVILERECCSNIKGVNNKSTLEGVNKSMLEGVNNMDCNLKGVNVMGSNLKGVNNTSYKQHPFNNTPYNYHPFNNTPGNYNHINTPSSSLSPFYDKLAFLYFKIQDYYSLKGVSNMININMKMFYDLCLERKYLYAYKVLKYVKDSNLQGDIEEISKELEKWSNKGGVSNKGSILKGVKYNDSNIKGVNARGSNYNPFNNNTSNYNPFNNTNTHHPFINNNTHHPFINSTIDTLNTNTLYSKELLHLIGDIHILKETNNITPLIIRRSLDNNNPILIDYSINLINSYISNIGGVSNMSCNLKGVSNISSNLKGVSNISSNLKGVSNMSSNQHPFNNNTNNYHPFNYQSSNQNPLNKTLYEQHPLKNTLYEQNPLNNTLYEQHPFNNLSSNITPPYLLTSYLSYLKVLRLKHLRLNKQYDLFNEEIVEELLNNNFIVLYEQSKYYLTINRKRKALECINRLISILEGVNYKDSNYMGDNYRDTKQQGVNYRDTKQQGVNISTNKQDPVNNSTYKQDPVNISTNTYHPINNSTNTYHPFNDNTITNNNNTSYIYYNKSVLLQTKIKQDTILWNNIHKRMLNSEKMFYLKGKYFYIISPFISLQSYIESVKYGNKYVYETIPVILHIYCEILTGGDMLGVGGVSDSSIGIKGVKTTASNLKGVNNSTYKQQGVNTTTSNLKGVSNNTSNLKCVNNSTYKQQGVNNNTSNLKGVNNNPNKQHPLNTTTSTLYTFFTDTPISYFLPFYSQILSKLSHTDISIVNNISLLLTRMLNNLPYKCTYNTLISINSTNTDVRKRIDSILKGVNSLCKKVLYDVGVLSKYFVSIGKLKRENIINRCVKGVKGEDMLEGVNNKGIGLEGVNNNGIGLEGVNNKEIGLEGVNGKGSNIKGVSNKSSNIKGVNDKSSNIKGVNDKE
ncbi:hypothetical protein LUQ84_001058 [Hamiltosporidium tvaerminnensis]|nr:hypothetical protein LUQ84_001058 [Hamiltosporidium tvaerminnensis]